MPKIYGSSEIWGDLLVTGSFSILGSASSINTTSLVVSDTIIALGHSQSGTPVLDEGLMFVRGTGATQAFIWDESDDTFALVETDSDHTVVGDISINSYSNLRVGGLTTSSLSIIGGTSGYILTSNASGDASWQSATVSSANFANTDLTFTGNRTHITNGNSLTISSDGNSFHLTTDTAYYMDSNQIKLGYNNAYIGSFNSSSFEILEYTGTHPLYYRPRLTIDSSSTWFNSYGLDRDFIVSGDTDTNLLFIDASTDKIGIGNNTPLYKLHVSGTVSTTGFRMTNGATNGYYLTSNSSGDASWTQLPGGTTGSGTTNYVSKWSGTYTLSNSQIIDDGSTLSIGGASPATSYKMYVYDSRTTTVKYGVVSQVDGNSISQQNYGYFAIVSGGTVRNMGIRSQISGTYGYRQGLSIEVGTSSTINNDYGIYTYLDQNLTSLSPIYGQYIQNSASASNKYGIYAQTSGTNSQFNYGIYSQVSGASSLNYGVSAHISGTYGTLVGHLANVNGTNNPNDILGFYSVVSGGDSYNIGSRNQVSGTYGIGKRQSQQNFLGSVGGVAGDTTLLNQIGFGVTSSTTLYNILNYNQGSSTYKYSVFNVMNQGESTYNYGVSNAISSTYSLQSYGGYSQLSGSGNKIGLYHLIGGGTYSDSNYGVWNTMNGSGTKFSLYNDLGGTYSDASYGMYNSFSNNGIKTGVYTFVTGTYSSTSHGVYNNLGSNGIKYGLFNSIFGTYSSTSYGMYNSLISNGLIYGLYNDFSGTYSSSRYGVYTNSTGGNSTTYGIYTILSGTGPNNYGMYVDAYSASNNYGIVVNRGDVIFNESGENYSFRVEGNTQSHLLYVDPYRERVYMGTTTSSYLSLIDYVNFTSLAVNTKSASYSCGFLSETSGGDLENYGFLSYIGTSKTYNSNTGFASQITLSSATETTNYGVYSIINGTGNGSDNTGIYTNVQSTGQNNTGINIDVSFGTASNTGISVDATGASANAIITTRGGVIFNEIGGDYDFRVEGDTDQNLLFTDASTDRIGVGTASPQYKLQVLGTVSTTGFRMTNGSTDGYVLTSNADGVGSWTASYRTAMFSHASLSPVDATTYYIGDLVDLTPSGSDLVTRRIKSQFRGEIVSVSIMCAIGGVNGSSENVTYQISNSTTATTQTITTTAQLTGDFLQTYTLSTPLTVSVDDEIGIRMVCPTWVTNPTSIRQRFTAKIRVY